MGSIGIFLLFLYIIKTTNCTENKSLLKFKCREDVIEAPVDFNLKLNEFTFCGKFSFKFLTRMGMVYMEPHTELFMIDSENKVGVVVLNGVYDLFFFRNQTVLPNTWQSICYTSLQRCFGSTI